MSTTDTTPQTIPILSESLPELYQRDELFAGPTEAQSWFIQFGTEVLKNPALDVCQNLLSASSTERRNRGLLILERAIYAQAAWLQLIELMAPIGKIEQLIKLTANVRDGEATPEEHNDAKRAMLDTYIEYKARMEQIQPFISTIVDLASEEAFIWAARTEGIVDHRGMSIGLYDWQIEVLDAVLADKGARQAPRSLELTANRLKLLSGLFFGEASTPKRGGGKSKGRSPRKAAKAERDSALRTQMRGKSGGKPGKGQRNS